MNYPLRNANHDSHFYGPAEEGISIPSLFAIALAESMSRIKCISILVAHKLFIIWCLL